MNLPSPRGAQRRCAPRRDCLNNMIWKAINIRLLTEPRPHKKWELHTQLRRMHTMKTLTRLVPFLVFTTFLFAACVKGPEGGGKRVKGAGPVRIGFSMDTLKEERWQRDKQLVEQRCKEVGAECQVLVADGSDSTQVNQCETFLTQGVDVLIVAPHNGQIAASIVEAAHKQGVPVISYDRLIRNADVDLYVSHQVVKIGQ